MSRLKIFFIFLLLCQFQLSGCGSKIANIDSAGENIICFGNSITEGAGSTEGNDYPQLLSQKLNMPVINAGVSGETTKEALKRIEKDVLERNPRLVIVEFSGNDFLLGLPMEETFDNLDRIVAMIQQKGAMVVLLEIRTGLFTDQYLAGFKRMARRRKAFLIPNILRGVLTNPSLKSDKFHPNDAGYRLIADRIYKAIRPLIEKKRLKNTLFQTLIVNLWRW